MFPFLSPWFDWTHWEEKFTCSLFISFVQPSFLHEADQWMWSHWTVAQREFLFSHNIYLQQGTRKINHDGSVKPPTLVHYHTGRVDYRYLGLGDIVSDLPVFLAIFRMREAKLNERRACTIFTHLISICTQKISWWFSPQLAGFI